MPRSTVSWSSNARMSTSTKPGLAEQLYLSSRALVHEGRYHDALIELQRAGNAFRSLDARAYLFLRKLINGVSGLANTLVLSGFCHQMPGNYKAALTCYETSLINSKMPLERNRRPSAAQGKHPPRPHYRHCLGDLSRSFPPTDTLPLDKQWRRKGKQTTFTRL